MYKLTLNSKSSFSNWQLSWVLKCVIKKTIYNYNTLFVYHF